jgi:uncharacterized membrane protein
MKFRGLLLIVNLAALGALALWFRCRALGNIPGVNGDEAWYGVTAWEILHQGKWLVQTPTGNALNPFFFGPLLLLQACCKPSIALLRIVAVASGVAALGLNGWLCRWVFDRRTAAISTLALALLPINIAYSRFAWDASQSLLATLPVWYFSLAAARFPARQDRLTAAAIVALLIAVLVHPTNVFAGAAIAASLAVRWRQFRVDPRRLTVLALAALALILWSANMVRMQGQVGGGLLGHLDQLVHPQPNPHAVVLYANLFSGETVYQYIAGAHSWLPWGVGLALVWAVLLAAVWRLWRCGTTTDRVLVAGWLLEVAAYVVLAGPSGMLPGQERYAICLIAPAVILAAGGAAVCWSGAGRPRTSVAAVVLALAAAWFVLADFQQHYFRFIEQTGGRAHQTFRTAAVEPKQAALDYILQHRRAGVTWIVADSWWSYWPLQYLSRAEPDVRVVEEERAAALPELALARAEGRTWLVRFCEGEKLRGEQILDYSGRPVLSVSRW